MRIILNYNLKNQSCNGFHDWLKQSPADIIQTERIDLKTLKNSLINTDYYIYHSHTGNNCNEMVYLTRRKNLFFDKIDLKYFDSFEEGEIIKTIINDVTLVNTFFRGYPTIKRANQLTRYLNELLTENNKSIITGNYLIGSQDKHKELQTWFTRNWFDVIMTHGFQAKRFEGLSRSTRNTWNYFSPTKICSQINYVCVSDKTKKYVKVLKNIEENWNGKLRHNYIYLDISKVIIEPIEMDITAKLLRPNEMMLK